MAEAARTENPGSLIRTRDGAVLRIAMNRPPANALSLGFMQMLLDAFDEARADDSVKVIILSSAARVFCAGHDLKEMAAARANADKGRAFFAETFALCSKLMQAIVRHPKPVIAEIDGVATAAGCQLVASCDLAIGLCHAGRQHRPVLFHTDGGPVAQCLAQAGDGNAADRRNHRRGNGA